MVDRQTLHSKIQILMEELELWDEKLRPNLPKKWEKHGIGVIFPIDSFRDPVWTLPQVEKSMYNLICSVMKVTTVARKSASIIHNDDFRRPQIELLFKYPEATANDGWIFKVENGIKYKYNLTKCMFSSGNITEKQRLSAIDLTGKVVVDLFAGIGYFTLSFLVHSKAKLVYACEWYKEAVEALKVNLKENKVEDRCIVLYGDNNIVCPKNVADVVNLGLIPTAEGSYNTACQALKQDTGGILHVHGNVDTKSKDQDISSKELSEHLTCYYSDSDKPLSKVSIAHAKWCLEECDKIQNILNNFNNNDDKNIKLSAKVIKLSKIKSYGPCVDHLVVDIKCSPQI